MKKIILPIGHKVLVKKCALYKTDSSGVKWMSESHGNAPMEIIALPDPIINPWMKNLKIGDILICKNFDADIIKDEEGNEFYVVEMEAEASYRAGQVLAVLKQH